MGSKTQKHVTSGENWAKGVSQQLPGVTPLGKLEYCDGSAWYPISTESFVQSQPITITGDVSGSGALGAPVPVTLATTVNRTGNQVFNYTGTATDFNYDLTIPNSQNKIMKLRLNRANTGNGAGYEFQFFSPSNGVDSFAFGYNSGAQFVTYYTIYNNARVMLFESFRLTGLVDPVYSADAATKNYIDTKLFDIDTSTTGQLNISRLSGYPNNPSYFLRGDGLWTSPSVSTVDINTGTTGQLDISRLSGYPTTQNAFLRGDGTWILPYINTLNINGTVSLSTYGLTTSGNLNATTGTLIANNLQAYNSGPLVVQSPLSLSNIGSTPINITSNTLQPRINFNNTNTAAYATGLVIQNNGVNAVEFGFNNSTNEAYVWATGAATLKFGTNAIKRMELLNNGSLVMYDNPTYALSGTYGYLNSSGSTGTATSLGYYSISCPNRIKASEFNAYSSEKKKRILGSGNTIETEVIEKFSRIPFFKYEHKDPIRDGSGVCYGVTAESLSEVLPDYVDEGGEDWIPNILEAVKVERHEGTCWLKLSKTPQLNSRKLRLMTDEKTIEAEIVQQDGCALEIIAADPLPDLVFVYGTYEACPSVSKQKIFEMGLIAIQNLLSRVALIENKFVKS